MNKERESDPIILWRNR